MTRDTIAEAGLLDLLFLLVELVGWTFTSLWGWTCPAVVGGLALLGYLAHRRDKATTAAAEKARGRERGRWHDAGSAPRAAVDFRASPRRCLECGAEPKGAF